MGILGLGQTGILQIKDIQTSATRIPYYRYRDNAVHFHECSPFG